MFEIVNQIKHFSCTEKKRCKCLLFVTDKFINFFLLLFVQSMKQKASDSWTGLLQVHVNFFKRVFLLKYTFCFRQATEEFRWRKLKSTNKLVKCEIKSIFCLHFKHYNFKSRLFLLLFTGKLFWLCVNVIAILFCLTPFG